MRSNIFPICGEQVITIFLSVQVTWKIYDLSTILVILALSERVDSMSTFNILQSIKRDCESGELP